MFTVCRPASSLYNTQRNTQHIHKLYDLNITATIARQRRDDMRRRRFEARTKKRKSENWTTASLGNVDESLLNTLSAIKARRPPNVGDYVTSASTAAEKHTVEHFLRRSACARECVWKMCWHLMSKIYRRKRRTQMHVAQMCDDPKRWIYKRHIVVTQLRGVLFDRAMSGISHSSLPPSNSLTYTNQMFSTHTHTSRC